MLQRKFLSSKPANIIRPNQTNVDNPPMQLEDVHLDQDTQQLVSAPVLSLPVPDIGLVINRLSQQIEKLYLKYNTLSKAINKIERSVDDLEQYGRRNCIIFHDNIHYPQ